MSEISDSCKIWTKFQSKQKNGEVLKLRIQNQPIQPDDDIFEFMIKYFVEDEAVHNAAGVSKNEESLKEYRDLMTKLIQLVPVHTTVCCEDNDSNTVDKILGVSLIQLMKPSDDFEELIKDMEFKTQEMQQLLYAAKILEEYTGDKANYEIFYYGRGIIVHPDYRGLGIANELVKVRNLIYIDQNIPMTCAWMSSAATQKAAHNHNWMVMSEVAIEELEEKTGLTFKNRVPTFKFMYKTGK